MLFIYFFAAV